MEVAFLQFAIRPKSIQVESFLVSLKDHKVTSTYFIHDFLTYWGISISQFLIFIRTSGMLIAPRHKKRNPSVTQIHKKRNRKHKVYISKLQFSKTSSITGHCNRSVIHMRHSNCTGRKIRMRDNTFFAS